ncbi:39S ribosomal protein L11, mitochondrial [Sitodiplosis mosellana]|uniref:39S ribosomal protein L11, mitochondrial n=1 Tax=Sitodiplosis mosellana TaxID=263140 RepID=UPI0024438E73|nr:39S ribosomal protein L11, mitochondrial [Sitodiplosis mosellana]
MPLKISSRLRALKKMQENVQHTSRLQTYVPAGMATSAPPLGPMLGQRSINIANFCKEFNEKTSKIKKGLPLPIRAKATTDKLFDLDIHQPPASYFIKQAAGIDLGAVKPGHEIAGKITLRHLYEIAKIKLQDPPNALLTHKQMCEMLVGVARSCGVQIVRNLDPNEYAKFLAERKIIIAQQKAALEEEREAKMLRSG